MWGSLASRLTRTQEFRWFESSHADLLCGPCLTVPVIRAKVVNHDAALTVTSQPHGNSANVNEQRGCYENTMMVLQEPMRFFKWLYRIFFKRHQWVYRNPYSRHCEKCGRHEDAHTWAWNLWNPAIFGWWEQVYPLPHSVDCTGPDEVR